MILEYLAILTYVITTLEISLWLCMVSHFLGMHMQTCSCTFMMIKGTYVSSCSLFCLDPPSIVIPLEPRVIAVVGGGHPNSTFICEATRVSACTTQISWIHNGRNTSQTVDQRFQAYITSISGRTVRSSLNATQLRGRDSGRIDCVAYCMVDVPGISRPLVLTTFRNTTLSVLSKLILVY